MQKKSTKYALVGVLSMSLALATCVIRFIYLLEFKYGDEIAWSLLVLGVCAVGIIIPFFCAKSEKSKRFFACLSTFADFMIALTWIEADTHELFQYYDYSYSRYYREDYFMDTPTIIFGLVCGILFIVTLFFAVYDERNESKTETELKRIDEKAATATPASAPAKEFDAYEKLLRLKELLDAGILSEEEFLQKYELE